jgi:hypothetical protein
MHGICAAPSLAPAKTAVVTTDLLDAADEVFE